MLFYMLCVCLHLSLENLDGDTPNFDIMTRTEKEWLWTYIEKNPYFMFQ